jgi:glycosyltransferase involved in cell wall biosynthesis
MIGSSLEVGSDLMSGNQELSPARDAVPTVSVVFPVHNGEPYLAEAIDSILGQTFGDFELIAVDDGSTDNSRRRLDDAAARDARVRVVAGQEPGLVGALNLGLSLARGEFIARMDADDISQPGRFALQVSYLRDNPDIAVVGSAITLIDASGVVVREISYPLAPADVERFLMEIGSALAHPAVMARRKVMLSVGGYRKLFQHSEDYDLWLRMAERYSLANLPDRLLRYRQHGRKASLRNAPAQRLATHMARLCAEARRSGQPDPLAGRSSLSLDDLDRFGLGAEKREAIVREVVGAAPPLAIRLRIAAVHGLRQILPAVWFEWLRNAARRHKSLSAQ